MSSRGNGRKVCVGAYGKPCPTARVVVTRYSERCPSCAARERLRKWDNTDQLERARANSPNIVKHNERRTA